MDSVVREPGSWSGTLLLARGGGPTVRRSAGHTAGDGSAPCSPETRFQAGSISKQVMTVVALGLVDAGRVGLHEPVAVHLPEAATSLRHVTLHHLLSHTSGLGHWGDLDGLPPVLDVPPPRAGLLGAVFSAGLQDPPGRRFRYSGPGFLVVAHLVEAVTRRSYADAVAEAVIGPARMHDTTSGRFPVDGAAGGHVDGLPITVEPAFTDLPGTGDLWTTTDDLHRYARALRSGTLLSPQLTAAMTAPHVVLDRPDPDDGPLAARSYGYGTFIGRVLGADGWFVPGDNPGFQSVLAHVPEWDADLAVLSNDAAGVRPALDELRRDAAVVFPGSARTTRS
ncbi:serine hydrolase domain-containing protein [Curtobacterium luteum]|uniref:serine hydrolase domain-containing protein n=1 Tax=Curtobacterium luteum TaxID=33881 RepID=UPI003820ABDF